METYRPGVQIEALANFRIQTLDGRVRDLQAEKARIEGIVSDYGILFEHPVWPAILEWA